MTPKAHKDLASLLTRLLLLVINIVALGIGINDEMPPVILLTLAICGGLQLSTVIIKLKEIRRTLK